MSILEVSKIQEIQREMVAERDWDQFHTPKNLAVAASVEASELLEIFQWLTPEEAGRISTDSKKYQAVQEEMADVLFYLLRLADILEIDLQKALLAKMEKSKAKYPVEKSKGHAKKYDEL